VRVANRPRIDQKLKGLDYVPRYPLLVTSTGDDSEELG
jgi:hypothetical protein